MVYAWQKSGRGFVRPCRGKQQKCGIAGEPVTPHFYFLSKFSGQCADRAKMRTYGRMAAIGAKAYAAAKEPFHREQPLAVKIPALIDGGVDVF